MKNLIGVYSSHDEAVAAIENLKKSGYPTENLSLLSKADIINNHVHVKHSHKVERAEVSIGLSAGTLLGVLTGVGVFAIPGLGFVYGAGALVGLIGGLDLGILAGGLTAILTGLGIDEVNAVKYEKHLNEGKFLVFAKGNYEEIERAQKVIGTQGLHMELTAH